MFILFGVVKHEGETLLGIFDSEQKAKAGEKFAKENPNEFDYNYFEIRKYRNNQMEYYYFRDNEEEQFPIEEMRIEKF